MAAIVSDINIPINWFFDILLRYVRWGLMLLARFMMKLGIILPEGSKEKCQRYGEKEWDESNGETEESWDREMA